MRYYGASTLNLSVEDSFSSLWKSFQAFAESLENVEFCFVGSSVRPHEFRGKGLEAAGVESSKAGVCTEAKLVVWKNHLELGCGE